MTHGRKHSYCTLEMHHIAKCYKVITDKNLRRTWRVILKYLASTGMLESVAEILRSYIDNYFIRIATDSADIYRPVALNRT